MPKKTLATIERAKELLAEIHTDRHLNTQKLSWLFRPLAVCPFPAYSLGKRTVISSDGKSREEYEILWVRQANNIKVKILGDPEYGVPHGQDTLIVLYLAMEAKRQGSRKIKVNFYRDFMKMFEMNPNDGRKYRLVVDSLRRIRNSKYSWEIEGETGRETGLQFMYIEEYDLYCDPRNPEQPALWDQYIVLSERFWHEISTHHIPSNLKAIIALKAKPAHLNFYIWLSYRVGQAYQKTVGKGLEAMGIHIPYWGENGLQSQLSSKISKFNDYRKEVKKWMKIVKEVWPRCPVEIEGDALKIHVTAKDQLDVQPKDTDAPRILPRPRPPEIPPARRRLCPKCGEERTLQEGRISPQKNFRLPDWWKCSGGCLPEAADAICKQCGQAMQVQNKGKGDYTYKCLQCGHLEGGENFWIQNSVFNRKEEV